MGLFIGGGSLILDSKLCMDKHKGCLMENKIHQQQPQRVGPLSPYLEEG